MEAHSNERKRIKHLPSVRKITFGPMPKKTEGKIKPEFKFRKLGLLHSKHISSLKMKAYNFLLILIFMNDEGMTRGSLKIFKDRFKVSL